MMIFGKQIKKRYIAGLVVIALLLVKCTGDDEDDTPAPEQASAQQPAPVQAQQYNDQPQSQQAPMVVAGAQPQPIIINTPPPVQNSSDNGFMQGYMMAHLHNAISGSIWHSNSGGSDNSSRRTVINKTYTTNHYSAPAAAPKPSYTPPPAAPKANLWSMKPTSSASYGTPKTTYSYTPPKRSSSFSSGSTSSYKPASSYKPSTFRSSSSSFRSSGFRSRR